MALGGFQQSVGSGPAPAVEGDFASQNPYWTFDAGPGALVAGLGGVTIGRFAWANPPVDADGTPGVVQSYGSGPVSGFVHREMQGLITAYLDFAGMTIQPGTMVTLMTGGDFWVKNNGAAAAVPGQKCYARLADGAASFAATGTPTAGATSSAGSVAASTSSVTGSINNGLLTVTAVGSGVLRPGTTISGTGVATGTKIVSQASGTTGGIGTYYVSIPNQTVTSTTISGTYGTFTAGGTITGTFAVGQVLSGTGVDAGTTITQLIGGTGGAGTYAVSSNTVVSSTAISATSNVETKWIAMSAGLPGELVKISSQPLG